jgi:hypothetical protein
MIGIQPGLLLIPYPREWKDGLTKSRLFPAGSVVRAPPATGSARI